MCCELRFVKLGAQHPFHIEAIVVLPDHLHCVWTPGPGDTNCSTRWSLIKGHFSRAIDKGERISQSRAKRDECGLWQRRFWRRAFWRSGMGTLALSADERVRDIRFSEDSLTVDLMDGRTISVPLEWYPRLAGASLEQLQNWTLCAAGYGIHWPDIDEDLSTEGMLRGAPAPGVRAESRTKRSTRPGPRGRPGKRAPARSGRGA